ncbi:uncharacterized protein LOC106758270 [Vigna radiata var. radiata]|uniref:Uncharacterized protein LOC106758270 n=1 Tax=Vigna radiata var. radiata TaxID=3916 RepID=A0A1S3TSE6_VIGRR|nr:uncharacterized protein LOC106758270 [Vigna radiata var. radiata]
MKKGSEVGAWDADCERAFAAVKDLLTNPPVMNRPLPNVELQIYLGVSDEVINAALVQDASEPCLIYFVSKVLQPAETRYQQVEKVALALLHASRRLRPYFQSHQVVVRTDHPISKILRKPDIAGRMVSWAIELSEFGLRFEPRGSIKGQHLAGFALELPQVQSSECWNLYVDGAVGRMSVGAGVVLEGPDGFLIEQSLVFKFKASNNQAEYEALIAGLTLTSDMGARSLTCRTDSQLVVGQMMGEFQVKDDQLLRYFHKANTLAKNFQPFVIKHIPWEENARADMLSKLSADKERGQLTTVIRQVLTESSVECMALEAVAGDDWRTKILRMMADQDKGVSLKPADARKMARYVTIGGDLYRRGFSVPVLKCVDPDQATYVLNKLHNGIYGLHTGAKALRARALRARYYWPTMENDAKAFAEKCERCQAHANISHAPPAELRAIISPWPFAKWGMDIVGPFPPGRAQKKFILVAVDYFTKWVEAEALATISAKQTNGQAEAANKTIVAELKRRLGERKGAWVDELPEVLWAYRCSPHGTTGESPFNLTYGTDSMLPVELGGPSLRRQVHDLQLNEEELRVELDSLEERRNRAVLHAEACRRLVERRYNTKVRPRSFHQEGNLVWRKTGDARKEQAHEKLSAKWDGPFRILEDLQNGAYRLSVPGGRPLRNTWNVSHLKFYFS